LKEFAKLDDAICYAKIQYTLYLGYSPFIADGMTSAYKSTGSRPDLDVGNEICEIPMNSFDDSPRGLLILAKNHFEAHSISHFSEW
jgi:hypothetical protein